MPLLIGIAARLVIAPSCVEGPTGMIECIGFQPCRGKAGAGDLRFRMVHELLSDALPGIGRMHVKGMHEVIHPIDEPGNLTGHLGHPKRSPRSRT